MLVTIAWGLPASKKTINCHCPIRILTSNFDSNKNPSLARILKKAGYKTCIAGKWQINDFRLQPESMTEHGFDDYCMWTGGEGGNIKKSEKRYWDPYIHTKQGSKTYHGKFGEDIFSDFIIDFMEKNKQNPSFCIILCAYHMVH